MYIHERDDWPRFRWDQQRLASKLAEVRHRQGRLIGRMEAMGVKYRQQAVLDTLTQDVLKSSEIEGELLERDEVRSSLACRLGVDIGGLTPADRHVEGFVEIMLDATQHFDSPLTDERLFGWHAALFPTGRNGMHVIQVGKWRKPHSDPMQVVSGPLGRERVHFEAPPARRLASEMTAFLEWFNTPDDTDPVLRAALAHLWFVTIHPFDDGNGRIARAIADMALARSEASPARFYSMSAQIRIERSEYYTMLERTQAVTLDISGWMEWFLGCLDRAFEGAECTLSKVVEKAHFWEAHAGESFNERQQKVLNALLDGFEGKLSSSKWARLTKCSQDTAGRDINDLLGRGILIKDAAGGRSTSYSLVIPKEQTTKF